MYEIKALMDYEYLAHKDSWEQARLIAYMVAQCNSTKQLQLSDITKFYWESEGADTPSGSISNEDITRLREQARQYITLNNK